jgi:hypothetical protein
MSATDPLSRITLLYHFTDRRNLPMIRQHGGLFSMAHMRRRGITPPAAGGNDWSQDADTMFGMDRFVHLCFRNNHPMEYRAREAGRIEDSIFLQVHPSVIYREGVRYTSDVANKSCVVAHTLDNARTLIDFEVLYTRTNWSDSNIQRRLRDAEKCEFLIPDFIDISLIRNFPNG